jgi:hypothetical protein
MVESRLNNSTMTLMQFSFTCQQSLSQKSFRHSHTARFDEVLSLSDQNLLHVIRVIHEEKLHGTDSEINDVTVDLGKVAQCSEAILSELLQQSKLSVRGWTRGAL